MSALLADLQAALAAAFPDGGAAVIADFRPAPAGSSTENWFFNADLPDGRSLPLMLRRAPQSEVVLVERADEYRVLLALNGSGFPAPKVWWQGEVGGRFAMLLTRCEGAAERHLLRSRSRLAPDPATRIALAQEMTDRLADLHALPVAGLPGPPRDFAAHALQSYEARLEALPAELQPELRLSAWWLREHLPPDGPVALVHGDYRPANMLVQGGRISAVLDWEFAHRGDACEDAGWYLARLYRAEHFPEGFTPPDFLTRYEAARGALPRDTLAWWAVFALHKLATIVIETRHAFGQGDDRRILSSTDRQLRALMQAVAGGGDPALSEGFSP